jgi:hypothetical protein
VKNYRELELELELDREMVTFDERAALTVQLSGTVEEQDVGSSMAELVKAHF